MRIPKLIIPLLVIIALFGGFALRLAFTQPSTSSSLGANATAAVECIVDGVKCKGTAALFTSHFRGVAGIGTIETFATEHRVVIAYDPAVISPEEIRTKIDSPVALDDSTSVAFYKCVSMDETEFRPSTAGDRETDQ